ncbi:MAG TPA: Lsr2 family protein [Mycobacterium sp.]
MATVTRTFMVDDIDGSQDDVGTVHIALDNVSYEIDLSAANAERLREKLARFVDNGKKVTTRPQGRKATRGRVVIPAPVGREQAQAVRDWARNNGYTVSERGRIPKSVQEAFDNAH